MIKFLKPIKADHQNQNNSLDNNNAKSKEKSPEKDSVYKPYNLDEIYGKAKITYKNLQFMNQENRIQELKFNTKFKVNKKGNKKDIILAKDKKINKKKENSRESIFTNNLNLNKTESDYNYQIHPNIAKYFKNCNELFKRKDSSLNSILEQLWKKLGVNENYINHFNTFKNLIINSEEKENFLKNEIENLERLKDILINLNKEIEMREIKLGELKILFENLNKENDINNIKKLLNESYDVIIFYINISIRVVEYYLLFKEIVNQGNSKHGKFNIETIKKNFELNKFDSNYLLKMRTDTNFLNNLKTNEFKLNKDVLNLFKADPFLYCLNNIIQIPFDIKEKIKYCQYYLIQEGIFESLNRSLKEPKTNSARKNSQTHIKIDASFLKKNFNHHKIFEESKNPEENINRIINTNTNVNIPTNINDNLNISYYSGKITEFIPIYSEYYEKIPEEQKTIFHINKDPLKYFEHNFYPKIILCKDKVTNIIKGMCIYSVLFKSYDRKPNEIIIEHISSYNKEEMENILTKMLEFIKENHILKDLCKNYNKLNTEIYLDLYYNLVNDKFEIDKDIKDFISKTLKFKWVKLENISKVIRFQKMKHIIPNENNFNDNNENNDKDTYSLCSNFRIKDNFAINFVKKLIEDNSENLDINNIIKKINPYNILYIISIMKKIQNIKIRFDYLLSKMNTYFTNIKLLTDMPLASNENNNEMNIYALPDDLKLINECFTERYYDQLIIGNKIDIFPLFDGCISIKHENFFYNRIECQNIKIVKENTTEQRFYLLKTVNNENISILISSNLNDHFKKRYLNDIDENNPNINISLNFEKIYNNLIENQPEEESMNNYLYIPAFSIEQKYKLKNNRNENHGDENVIDDLCEDYKIEFLPEELITKKNNKKSNNFDFNIIEKEIKNRREYIINDDFIIFILDLDMMENIGIIPVMSFEVHKENFIPDSICE